MRGVAEANSAMDSSLTLGTSSAISTNALPPTLLHGACPEPFEILPLHFVQGQNDRKRRVRNNSRASDCHASPRNDIIQKFHVLAIGILSFDIV